MRENKFIEKMKQLPEFEGKSDEEILTAKNKLAEDLEVSPERFAYKEAYQFFSNLANASKALTSMEQTSKRDFDDPTAEPSNPIGQTETPTSLIKARPGKAKHSGLPSRGPEHLAEERIDRTKRS